MTEITMTKRRAREGEVGLFIDHEVFESDMATLKVGAQYSVKITGTADTSRFVRFSWVLAQIVADNSELHLTKEDARESLLIEAKHYRMKYDHLREKSELVAKPTANLDAVSWLALIKRMVWVAESHYGIPPEELNREMPR